MCGSDCDEGGACVSPGMLPRALTSRRPYLRLPARPPACLPAYAACRSCGLCNGAAGDSPAPGTAAYADYSGGGPGGPGGGKHSAAPAGQPVGVVCMSASPQRMQKWLCWCCP